jgi:hypothetical protein
MYVVHSKSGAVRTFPATDDLIEWWATNTQNVPKPPASWMAEQRDKGRSESAAGMIWYHRYKAGDRLAVWMRANEDDYRRAGYAV